MLLQGVGFQAFTEIPIPDTPINLTFRAGPKLFWEAR